MTTIDWAAVARFRAVRAERHARGILPTDGDRSFFDKNPRRFYHTRSAVVGDHWLFACADVGPSGFLAIVHRPSGNTCVCAVAKDEFGEWVDSDAYGAWRFDCMGSQAIDRLTA